MHHTNKRLPSVARWIAGALAAVFPFATFALGLGKLSVRSALNEPLNAEVEITSVSEKELKGLQVGLAPRADFDQAGIDRLPFLSQVKFNVSKRADGNYFIQLRTDDQIVEPFLHILLTAEWPGGRIVREYTALIDPPVQALGKPTGIEVPQTAPEPTVTAPAQMPASPMPEPVAQMEPKPAAPAAEAAPMESKPIEPVPPAETAHPAAPEAIPSPPPYTPPSETTAQVEPPAPRSAASPSSAASVAAGWSMDGGYNVKWGDTAWRIAEQLRTDDKHTIEQIVLALYRVNPQAFFENNINNLKAGAILKVPESAEIEAVVPVQARTQFRAQYDAWQEYKIKLAGASGAIKVVDAEPKTPVEKPAAPAPQAKTSPPTAKAPADKAASQDELLKIVRSTPQGEKTTPDKKPAEGETAKDGSAREQQALADRVSTFEESLASKQAESKEIGEKLSQVRAQLKRESRLIQVEQQELAAAQTKAQPKPAEEPKAEPAKPAPAPKAEAPKAEAPKAVEPAPAKPPVAAAPKPRPAPVTPPPAEEKGFIDDLMQSVLGGDNLLLIVLGIVIVLSGGIALVYVNRRRKSIAEFEESILQSEGIATGEPAVTTDTSGQVVSTGDTSFLSDFSQGGMGNIHTDEVDPIAEAEVYLAYGRDETAEEILREAVVKNPAREELKLKLLEIYSNRSDVRAFETLAEEMYAAMGGRPSKNWPRVEEMGRKLNPGNPMFQGGAAAAAVASAAPGFMDTAKMKVATPPAVPASTDTQTAMAPPPASADTGSDFDFDLGTGSAGTSDFDLDLGGDKAAKPAEQSIDFAADFGTETPAAEASPSEAGLDMDIGQSAESNGVDFDFGDKEEAVPMGAPETELAIAEAPAAPVTEGGESPQWDETATKLDLARAYIDMGDSEGARSILDEVMSEGSDQQKTQAKELAAQLG